MGGFYLSAALIASMTLLVGCGGGDSANTTSPDKGGVVATKIVFDALNIPLFNCGRGGKPLADVKLLAHSADGKTIKTFTTDAQGHIEAEWPQNARHFTAIYKNSKGFYSVVVSLNVEDGDFGKNYFSSGQPAVECQCTDLTINWGDIKASMPEYQLTLTGELQGAFQLPSSSAKYRVCKDEQGRYGKLQAMLMPTNSGPSYVMEAEISSLVANPNVNLSFAQFKKAGREVNIVTNTELNLIRTFTPTQLGRAYNTLVSATETPRVFELDGVKSTVTISYSKNFTGFSNFGTKRVAIEKTDSSVILNAPTNQLDVLQAIEKNIGNSTDIGGIDYDFTFLTDYTETSFYLTSTNISAEFIGPMKAKIPDFEWPQEVQALMRSSNFDLEVAFIGYNPSWDYRTYRNKLVQKSRDASLESKEPGLLSYRVYGFDFETPVSF
jgi:hypothetical protein